MTVEIVPATEALIADTEEWLDEEETAYNDFYSAEEEDNGQDIPPQMGFRCNWNLVKRSWRERGADLHIMIQSCRSIGFLWGTDILEIKPDKRGQGYGRLLADFMLNRSFDQGRSVVEIEIAPRTAIPFWQHMGFTLVEGRQGPGGGCYAYRRFERKFSLGAGPRVSCSIEFFTEPGHYNGSAPFYSFSGQGELLPDGSIQLPERVICFDPKDTRGDPFARISLRDEVIFFDKVKRTEASDYGMMEDRGYTYYIEHLWPPLGKL